LYSRNATVYICGRTEDKVQTAIKSILQPSKGTGKGRLEPLTLDLADLVSVKKAAQDFLLREEQLHVLVHNAGVMTPPRGSKSVQVS
jgi:retinol dehydrogenase 12